jgi:hypothetical protein
LLDLPAMPFDNPIEWVDTPRSNYGGSLEDPQWQECDVRDLPLDAKHTVRVALARVLRMLDEVIALQRNAPRAGLTRA